MASVYLLCYNSVLFVGWSYCMYLTALNISAGGSVEDLWKKVEVPLKIFQTAALLEILHCMLRIQTRPFRTAMQVFSRVWIVWGIIDPVQFITTKQSVSLAKLGPWNLQLDLTSLMVAWSLAEIIRYSFYALKELHIESFLSKWLRYSAFVVLYPLGVSSEISIVYMAMPYIKTSHLWSLDMPNALNFAFSYHYLCILTTFCYLPFFPQLYLYMFAQRRKVLATKPKDGPEVLATKSKDD